MAIASFLSTIRGYVNEVEHAKIKKKFEKRLEWIKSASAKLNFDHLLEKFQRMEDRAIEKPNDVFEVIKILFDELDNYKTGVPKSNGAAKVAEKKPEEAQKEVSNDELYKVPFSIFFFL